MEHKDTHADFALIAIIIIVATLFGMFVLKISAQNEEVLNKKHDCALELRDTTGMSLQDAWNNCD